MGLHARSAIPLLLLTLSLASATGLEARGGFTPHIQPERAWHHEHDFEDDPSLHATPEHVVIMHLESSPTGELIVQRIPYFFEHPSPFTFCIKDEDPHVVEMTLVAVANGEIVVRVTRGGECVTVTVDPGRYDLYVTHDGTDIGDDGKKAFVHIPRRREAAGAAADKPAVARDQATGTYLSGLCAGWSALQTLDGQWLVLGDGGSQVDPTHTLMVRATRSAPAPDFQWALPFWQICPGSSSFSAMPRTDLTPRPQHSAASVTLSGDDFYVKDGASAQPVMGFSDLGGFELTMSATLSAVCGTAGSIPTSCSTTYPVVVDSAGSHQLRKIAATTTTATGAFSSTTTSNSPTTFRVVMTQYPSGVPVPPLLAGQVEIRYSDTTYVNVFNTSVADLFADPLDFLVTSPNISRIRLGPQTVVTFFARSNYAGTSVTVGADAPTLGESLGISFDPRSLRIQTARDFVVATHQCRHCNLNDVDFSGLTFQGATTGYLDFTGSTFHRANLSRASFSYVVFDHADFGNATFGGTRLDQLLVFCTNFANTDLSTTTVVGPVYQTDFSCRLGFTGAVLAPHTFPTASWRFSNLTGATITNVAGVVLSSREAPLDLRGAFLNGVSLRGAVLDYADLGCVNVHLPDTTVSRLCTDLKTFTTPEGIVRRADLTGASLKHASLVGAQLQGVALDNANLTSANLCTAQLNQFVAGLGSASLIGAELKDTNLFGVEATGATFNYANFYSSGGSSNCAVTDCSTGGAACATIAQGTFNSAKFVGAYLPGLDMTGVRSAQGVTFTDAFLVGATLSGNLTTDPATGARVTFDGAFLQGADFSGATVGNGTVFKDALFTIPGGDADGGNIIVKLDPRNVAFPGYTPSSPGSLGCVLYIYNDSAKLPVGTDLTCPDGSHGACSPASWNTLPATTAIAWTSDFSNPAGCNDIDFNWILQE